jgi:hypothetical protein
MKPVKFFTTFSKYGYLVYGKSWIESFLEMTKNYSNITATIYIDGMNTQERNKISIKDKLEILDFETSIPEHKEWMKMFNEQSKHGARDKKLCKKFSFKSFAIIKQLENSSDNYLIWLDADCIFKNSNFNNFPESFLNNKFLACQIENGSEHVESGFIAFDSSHIDKINFLNNMKNFYLDPLKINTFGQLFDGFVIFRSINHSEIDVVDLNAGYGLGGIQSDPNCTFLNPIIGDRFLHNIGITGKRNYSTWKDYAKYDEYFKAIHGVDPSEIGETTADKIKAINQKLAKLRR